MDGSTMSTAHKTARAGPFLRGFTNSPWTGPARLRRTDAAGYSGLEDEVDPHTWQLIKGVALATVLGISSEMALNQGSTNRPSIIIAGGNSLDNSANQAGQRLVSKDLAVQPTLTVRPGFPVRVIVNRDIVLKPYAR
jgi:type IV secretory pathway VirB10-like protein